MLPVKKLTTFYEPKLGRISLNISLSLSLSLKKGWIPTELFHFVNYCRLWTLMVWHFWQLYAQRWMFFVLLPARVGRGKFHFPRFDALPLSHRDSIMSKIHYEVHTWRAPRLATRQKPSFSVSSSCSKPYYLSYSIYKNDAIDIADPSSTRDACHTWIS